MLQGRGVSVYTQGQRLAPVVRKLILSDPLNGGRPTLRFVGFTDPYHTFQVQISIDLVNWTTVPATLALVETGGQQLRLNQPLPPGEPQHFFRVQLVPIP